MNTRRWATALWWFVFGVAIAGIVLALAGCGAAEVDKAKGVGWTAGGGAVGALFSPVGAAIGAGVGYLFGGTSSGGSEPIPMGLLARLGYTVGGWLDHFILIAAIAYAVILFLVPASRDNLLAFFGSKMPLSDRLKALVAGLVPRPHSPPAAQARKIRREESRKS